MLAQRQGLDKSTVFFFVINGAKARWSIAIGENALSAEIADTGDGSNNIAIGNNTLKSFTSGQGNLAIGTSVAGAASGDTLGKLTTGSGNIAIGANSLPDLTVGGGNIAIGMNSCQHIRTASNIVCIGNNVHPPAAGRTPQDAGQVNHVIYLGSEDDTVFIAGNLVVDKHVVLNRNPYHGGEGRVWMRDQSGDFGRSKSSVNTSTDVVQEGWNIGGADAFNPFWYYSSDIRLKDVKGENVAGLEQLKKLKVFDYTFKKDDKKTPRVGVMAQDLQKIFPNAVIKGDDGYLTIRMEDMFYAAINAIKELDVMVQNLITQMKDVVAKVNNHDKEIETLKTKVQALEKQNKLLEERIQKLEKHL